MGELRLRWERSDERKTTRAGLFCLAVVTRNLASLGPSCLQVVVTTAVVTRNCSPLGPNRFTFLVTTAMVTRNCGPLEPMHLCSHHGHGD